MSTFCRKILATVLAVQMHLLAFRRVLQREVNDVLVFTGSQKNCTAENLAVTLWNGDRLSELVRRYKLKHKNG